MPAVVKALERDAAAPEQALEVASDVVAVERRAVARGEDQPRLDPGGAREQAVLELAGAVRVQRRHQRGRQVHRAAGTVRLRRDQPQRAAHALQLLRTVSRPAARSTSCHRSPSASPCRSPSVRATVYSARPDGAPPPRVARMYWTVRGLRPACSRASGMPPRRGTMWRWTFTV